MTRIRTLSIGVALLALAACTTAQEAQFCARATTAGATAETIGHALEASGVAPGKIGPIVAEIQRGEAVLTASCAVIAATPASADAPPVQPVT